MKTKSKIPYHFIIFFLGLFGVAASYVISDNLPGDIGDARFNLYILEHFFLALTNQVNSFFDANFFYPAQQTILFCDTHFGSALIYVFFRFDGFDPEYSYAAWFLSAFILNYWCCFYIYQQLKLSKLSAAIGAFLFTFSLPIIAQDGHSQLMLRCFVPFAFFNFYRYLQFRNFTNLALTFFFLSLQLLVSVYSGIFVIFLLAAFLLSDFFVTKNKKIIDLLPKKLSLLTSLPILAATIPLFLLFAIPYFKVQNLYKFGRSIADIEPMLPRIESFFYSDRSLLWIKNSEIFSNLPMAHEQQMFIGIGALISLLILFLNKNFLSNKNEEETILGIKFNYSLSIIISITLMVGTISLYPILTIFPGISSLRAISREIIVLLFPIGFLVGLTFDKINKADFKIISSSALIFILSFLIISDPILAKKLITHKKEWRERIVNLEAAIPKEKINSSSILAFRTDNVNDEIDAMFVAQKLNIPTINGYSANFISNHYFSPNCEEMRDRIDKMEKNLQDKISADIKIDHSNIIFINFGKSCI